MARSVESTGGLRWSRIWLFATHTFELGDCPRPPSRVENSQPRQSFAAAIHGSEALRGQVRVGLFVGEGEHTPQKAMGPEQVITDKDTQRDAPPDILLPTTRCWITC